MWQRKNQNNTSTYLFFSAVKSETTLNMLEIFYKRPIKRHIFIDFAYMDERESQYIRKMHEANNYYSQYSMGYPSGYSFNSVGQVGLVGHPLNFMGGITPTNPISPLINMPATMLRPASGDPKQAATLGFQMNPVSKNKKK
ncbi:unnamed protein product [Sphagnum balticum]